MDIAPLFAKNLNLLLGLKYRKYFREEVKNFDFIQLDLQNLHCINQQLQTIDFQIAIIQIIVILLRLFHFQIEFFLLPISVIHILQVYVFHLVIFDILILQTNVFLLLIFKILLPPSVFFPPLASQILFTPI